VRKLPQPIKKIIGDLSDTVRVLVGLDVRPAHGREADPWLERTSHPQPGRAAQEERGCNETDREGHIPAGQGSILAPPLCCGTTPRSTLAIANLKNICEEHLAGRYDLEVIDIYQKPILGKGEQIFAAPTLIKKLPLPVRKLIGDMSDRTRYCLGLDIR
jgi:circadian clock protein KaiB